MKILFINEVCGAGSTGRIVCELADKLTAQGHTCKVAYGRHDNVPQKWRHYAVRIGKDTDVKRHALRTRILDETGFGSKKPTKEFLKWAEEFDPDMVWLHNIHGYFINIEMLFAWLKSRPHMKIQWTLHDCWAFTGHCAYFTMAKCEKWQTKCENCSLKKDYPTSLLRDNSANNFARKKAAFTGVKDMTLITPSQWLADLAKQSFLQEYPVEVQYNQIDTNIFKPTESDFREKYGLVDKILVLGVANVWEKRKGLEDFLKLREMLDNRFAVVLVGLNGKQIQELPSNILGISRTSNIEELVKIYSAADVFVNPSKEETFGMTTAEALACGTDVVVYKDTACEEVVLNSKGTAVEQTVDAIYQRLMQMYPKDV